MLREDNSGFVNFPIGNTSFSRKESRKTIVYIVAFDTVDNYNNPYVLSNLKLIYPSDFVTDDVSGRYQNSFQEESSYSESRLITSICLGWSEHTFEFKEDSSQWYATFRDLTAEGRKLYYSIKKLHNNKEIRILTFNNI
jgi:hypothetical protein